MESKTYAIKKNNQHFLLTPHWFQNLSFWGWSKDTKLRRIEIINTSGHSLQGKKINIFLFLDIERGFIDRHYKWGIL